MGLDGIRAEIALRRLIGRQRKEMLQLENGSFTPTTAKAILQWLLRDKAERLRNAELPQPVEKLRGGRT